MYSIGILGLGYIGLPLTLAFAKKNSVFGFDINLNRVSNLKKGIDSNKEFSTKEIIKNKNIVFTSDIYQLRKCTIFIVTVPTPIYKNKKPNLSNLKQSCEIISKIIIPGIKTTRNFIFFIIYSRKILHINYWN